MVMIPLPARRRQAIPPGLWRLTAETDGSPFSPTLRQFYLR